MGAHTPEKDRLFYDDFWNFGGKERPYGGVGMLEKKSVRRGAHTKKKIFFLEQQNVVKGVFELAA